MTAVENHTTSHKPRGLIRQLLASPPGMAGTIMVGIAVLVAVFAPLLAPYHYAETHFESPFQNPGTAGFLLGTDDLGRDVLSRLIYGVRTSLHIGLIAVGLAVVVGTPLGLLAGYSKAADTVISRFTDVALAFPFLIIAVGLTAINGPSLTNAAIALGVAHVPIMVRVVRGEALRVKNLEFVTASNAMNASHAHVLFRHVLPNAGSAIIVQATVIMPVAVIGEAMLSFLGLGIQPPEPSLGIMLSDAQQYIYRSAAVAIFPGLAIAYICFAFNLFGDALRDALDPNTTRTRGITGIKTRKATQ